MRHERDHIMEDAQALDNLMSVCGAIPQGDELPQVAGINDILVDVYSDVLNMPHEYAAGAVFHQYDDNFDYEELVH